MSSISINYRILEINEKDHSFSIRYFTDDITEDMLALEFDEKGNIIRNANGYPSRCKTDTNITLYKTPSPTDEELLETIKLYGPADYFYLMRKIADENIDTSMSALKPLINTEGEFIVPTNSLTYV